MKRNFSIPNNQDTGYLELRYGPMMSGKSHWLMSQLTIYASLGLPVLYINHKNDTRETMGDEYFSTHGAQFNKIPGSISRVKTDKLVDLSNNDYIVIGIDEAQFFSDLIPTVKKWVDEDKKMVYCAGLDGDYKREFFGDILKLIPLADSAAKMTAKCPRCLEEKKSHTIQNAPFTCRLVKSDEKVLVGGADKYIPLCRYHYNLTS